MYQYNKSWIDYIAWYCIEKRIAFSIFWHENSVTDIAKPARAFGQFPEAKFLKF
jgi:hypothetical protein